MKKYFIETYGCQMNEYDSELIASILDNAGYMQGETLGDSDIIIFNTCAIRQHAEDRVLGRVAQLSKMRRTKNIAVGIVGCVAQEHGETLLKKAKYIDFVVGTDNYYRLPKVIVDVMKKKKRLTLIGEDKGNDYGDVAPKRAKKLFDHVAIMRGCNNFCTYCIVPYVRGRERSRSVAHIIHEVNQMVEKGYREVTLIGQNVNSYQDKNKNTNFAELLRLVHEETSMERIRFMTSHPKDMTNDVIENVAKYPRLCNHIHLPVQSGSTKILKAMNRGYSREKYLEMAHFIRKTIDNVSITSDIITGFPRETEKDFMDTVTLMEEIKYDMAFTYKYSPRKFTKAAEMINQVSEKSKQRRLEYIINLQQEITEAMNDRHLGKEMSVLVEKVSKKNPAEYTGRATNNKWVLFEGNDKLIGQVVNIKIEKVRGFSLFGTIIK